MSSWARAGVKCVCVDDGAIDTKPFLSPVPPKGSILEVIRFIPNSIGRGPHIVIKGFPNPRFGNAGDVEMGWRLSRFRPLISQADDVAMFTKLIETMKPTERLDVLAELLDTTPSTP